MILRALQRVKRSLIRQEPGALEVRGRPRRGPWVSFRYSFRSIVAERDQAHVVVRERRLQDGRLESEDFEGTIDRHSAPEVLEAVQRALEERARTLFDSLAGWLLPAKRPDDDE
jgi:hypothetical protein